MSHVDRLVAVEQLDDNYATWHIRMQYLLSHKGLWKAVLGEGSADSDEKALALIGLHVKDHHLSTLAECQTAKAVWDKLAAIHKAKSGARRMLLRKELTALSMEEGESLTVYVDRAKGIRNQLIAAGYAARDDEIGLAVLAGLPQEYAMVVTMLESAETLDSIDEMLPKLLQVEQRVVKPKDTSHTTLAYYGRGGRTGGRGGAGPGRRDNGNKECWRCGRKGHIQAECHLEAQGEPARNVGGRRPRQSVAL
jgi:hypothetical protein